jgi:hypothetical protein
MHKDMNTKEKAIKAMEYVVKARLLFDEALQEYSEASGRELNELSTKYGTASYEVQGATASLIGDIMATEIEDEVYSRH